MRTMNFVRFFANLGSVDIGYSNLAADTCPGSSIFSNEYFLKRTNYPSDFIGRMSAISRGRPYPVGSLSKDGGKLIRSAIESLDYDVILVRYTKNAHFLLDLPARWKKRVILDFDDVLSGSLYERLFPNTRNVVKRLLRNANKRALVKYERKCRDLNVSLFCSEEDKRKIMGGREGGVVVPNIYENSAFENGEFANGYENGNLLLFVGTLSYGPNKEGLRWFLEGVFPAFKKRYADGKLLVVGRCNDEVLEKLRKVSGAVEGVEIHPNVPDLMEFYDRCRAVVVPILAGGGTRIKILEAALARRPVLATPIGAEGLGLADRRDVLLFRNAEGFCAAYEEIGEREKYYSIASSAREIVRQKYSREAFDEAMMTVVLEIDRRRGDQAAGN